jgi:hypothetical protein
MPAFALPAFAMPVVTPTAAADNLALVALAVRYASLYDGGTVHAAPGGRERWWTRLAANPEYDAWMIVWGPGADSTSTTTTARRARSVSCGAR